MRDLYVQLIALLDRRERRQLSLLVVLILISGLFDVIGVGSIFPFLAVLARPETIHENEYLSMAYEWGGFTSDQGFLIGMGVAIFLLLILGLSLRTLSTYLVTRFAQMRVYSIGSRLLKGYLGQPYVWFLNRHSSSLSHSVLNEVSQVVNGLMLPAFQLISHVTLAVLLIGLVIVADPMVALTALVLLVVCYGTLYLFLRKLLTRLGRKRVDANRARFKVVQEATAGIKDVKVLGVEAVLAKRFDGPALKLANYNSWMTLISSAPRQLIEAILFGGMVVLILHMMLTRPGGLAEVLPIIGLFAFAGFRLFPAVQQIYGTMARLRYSRPALDALKSDLEEIREAERRALPVNVEPLPLTRSIKLSDVTFAYPDTDRSALQGINIEIGARTSVGLVGGTGAGKTTAVDILLGLLQPQKGALVVDGTPVTGDKLMSWRRSVGYVPQQIFLADETVAANIAFGIPPDQIDMDAVVRAARIAELHDFVTEELPEGYQTTVGERGVRLSGGQRQRIGIARALYHDPEVLVLDEATSALDNLTERAVMDAVRNLADAKTVIMIAHRLSTVRNCDEIFLLQHGHVVASGTYDRLLEESETFKAMAEGVA